MLDGRGEIPFPSAYVRARRLVFESPRAVSLAALPPNFWRQTFPPFPNLFIDKKRPIAPLSLTTFLLLSPSLSPSPIFEEMVMALGPGRFYGSSLPRPRFYTEVKLNEDRVDPPVPVMDPLLSWANEAHWSMGGLSFKRHRLQGRIEGSIKKLRAQQERTHRNSPSLDRNPTTKPRFSGHMPQSLASLRSSSFEFEPEEEEEEVVVQKKTKDASIVSSPSIGSAQKRKRVRRLGDEFDRIAEQQQMGKKSEAVEGVSSRTRSRKPDVEEVELAEEPAVAGKGSAERRKRKEAYGAKPRRTSPRTNQLI